MYARANIAGLVNHALHPLPFPPKINPTFYLKTKLYVYYAYIIKKKPKKWLEWLTIRDKYVLQIYVCVRMYTL